MRSQCGQQCTARSHSHGHHDLCLTARCRELAGGGRYLRLLGAQSSRSAHELVDEGTEAHLSGGVGRAALLVGGGGWHAEGRVGDSSGELREVRSQRIGGHACKGGGRAHAYAGVQRRWSEGHAPLISAPRTERQRPRRPTTPESASEGAAGESCARVSGRYTEGSHLHPTTQMQRRTDCRTCAHDVEAHGRVSGIWTSDRHIHVSGVWTCEFHMDM